MRVNDLHTASLTAELAARFGAAAVINDDGDRNEVDLNRIAETHERAPELLARLAELIELAIARHGRATLLTIHGWNVVQPAVDLGLGCTPGPDPFRVSRRAAVSPGFAETAVRGLVDACVARGIGATIGARYPARHRENLLQLFTPYAEDSRDLVRALAAPKVDAVQLEPASRPPARQVARAVDRGVAVPPLLVEPPDASATRASVTTRARVGPTSPTRVRHPGLCGLMASTRAVGASPLPACGGPCCSRASASAVRTAPSAGSRRSRRPAAASASTFAARRSASPRRRRFSTSRPASPRRA